MSSTNYGLSFTAVSFAVADATLAAAIFCLQLRAIFKKNCMFLLFAGGGTAIAILSPKSPPHTVLLLQVYPGLYLSAF